LLHARDPGQRGLRDGGDRAVRSSTPDEPTGNEIAERSSASAEECKSQDRSHDLQDRCGERAGCARRPEDLEQGGERAMPAP